MILNYKTQGSGKPILLLHGLFGSLSNLGNLARFFSHEYSCYQIDLPNHGLSPHFASADYAFQAKEVKKLIDELNLNNITLVGHSMGGKVAMMLALLYPHLIEKLVVLDIAPVSYQNLHHKNVIKGLKAVATHAISSRAQADAILARYIDELDVRQFLLSSFYKNQHGDMIWRFNLSTIINKYPDISDWQNDNLVFLGDTLFVKGQLSDYLLPAHKVAINTQFPKAKFSVVANAGHWLHNQKPESVIRFIEKFLKDVAT